MTGKGGTHRAFAAHLGIRLPNGSGAWWTFDMMLDACVVMYWTKVYWDPARCPAAALAVVA